MAAQYARVEIMGHRVVVGRVSEVTRFGVSFCAVEPVDKDGNFEARQLYGGASVFCLTELDRATAIAEATPYWERVAQLPEHESDGKDDDIDGQDVGADTLPVEADSEDDMELF